MTLEPLNFADEAHAAKAYIDPLDPEARKLIGSTTVIKKALPPYLVPWAAKLTAEYAVDNQPSWTGLDRAGAVDLLKKAPDRSRDQAGDRGTIVHRFLELAARDEQPDEVYDANVAGYISAGLRFLNEWEPKFLWSEATVFHPELGYGGTLDFIAELPGLGLVVGDFKTSKGVYPEVAVQLSSYRYADHAVAHDDTGALVRLPVPEVAGGVVVHIKPDGTYDLRPVAADEAAFDVFRHCLTICDWKARSGVIARALPAPKNSGEVPASASSGNESAGSLSTSPAARHTSPDTTDPLTERTAWLKGRIVAILQASPPADMLGQYNVATAGDLMAAWWPEGVPTLREGGHTPEQLDAIDERAGMVEAALGLPFCEPDPTVESDNVRVPADDPRVVALIARLRNLPADLLRRVETEAAVAGITAKVSLGISLGKLRTLDEIVNQVGAELAVRWSAIDTLMAEFKHHPAGPALSGLYDGLPTADDVQRLMLMGDAIGLGFLDAVDPTNDPENEGPGEGDVLVASTDCEARLVPTVHPNKRDALNYTKRAAKHHGVPAPKSFAEILGDPLLVALAICELPETTAANTAAA
jgi:hypothetical protein